MKNSLVYRLQVLGSSWRKIASRFSAPERVASLQPTFKRVSEMNKSLCSFPRVRKRGALLQDFAIYFWSEANRNIRKVYSVCKRRRKKALLTTYNLQPNQGFALLITLVVVSVILAIGLSLLFVTTKQYLLSVTAIESEKAFQSAQVGLECMRFHRAQSDTRAQFLREGENWPPSVQCSGVGPNSPPGVQATTLFNNSGRLLYNYRYQYTFGGDLCAEPSLYIADLREAETDLTYNLSGEGLGTITCTAGTICTIVFARGYNRPCDQLDSIFTLQREITIEY